jgi:LysR family transcriptional regulator of abg operon
MELRHLRHFVAIVECRSFSRAAHQCQLTQSALTRSIKTLEHSLGVQVLERRTTGAAPTVAGSALYAHALLLLNEAERMKEGVQRAAQGQAGVLSLAISPMFGEDVLARALAAFAAHYERVALQVFEGDVAEAVPMLGQGLVDMVIAPVPDRPIGPNLHYQRLGTLQWQVYAAPDHPLCALRSVSADQLLEHRWVIKDHDYEMELLGRLFARHNAGLPGDVVKTTSLAVMRSLIMRGGMVGLMPVRYMRDTPALRLEGLGEASVRPVGLITRQDCPLPSGHADLLACFAQM